MDARTLRVRCLIIVSFLRLQGSLRTPLFILTCCFFRLMLRTLVYRVRKENRRQSNILEYIDDNSEANSVYLGIWITLVLIYNVKWTGRCSSIFHVPYGPRWFSLVLLNLTMHVDSSCDVVRKQKEKCLTLTAYHLQLAVKWVTFIKVKSLLQVIACLNIRKSYKHFINTKFDKLFFEYLRI